MARLVLSLDGQVLAEYNMSKERYTVGRLPDNDIRIDNPAVSGHHALVINILNDSFLEDLNSTNGTYVNGKIIKKHALQHGDVITVGHHALRLIDGDGCTLWERDAKQGTRKQHGAGQRSDTDHVLPCPRCRRWCRLPRFQKARRNARHSGRRAAAV